jgi:hypothetical protein
MQVAKLLLLQSTQFNLLYHTKHGYIFRPIIWYSQAIGTFKVKFETPNLNFSLK